MNASNLAKSALLRPWQLPRLGANLWPSRHEVIAVERLVRTFADTGSSPWGQAPNPPMWGTRLPHSPRKIYSGYQSRVTRLSRLEKIERWRV